MVSPGSRAAMKGTTPSGAKESHQGAAAASSHQPPAQASQPAGVFFSPPKLYGDAADTLMAWLRMRCVEGIVPGGAPGVVLTGRAGCGKVTTIRWVMRKLGIEDRALQVFHPWSAESAASMERAVVNAAVSTPPGKCAVLVVRQAELWALRSAAAQENSGKRPSRKDATTLAYWTKLVGRVCAAGKGLSLPRVAIFLCFPDMSFVRARTLVGLRGEDRADIHAQDDVGDSRAGAESASRTKRSVNPSWWKHIDLDDALLRNLGELSSRISRFLGNASSPLPFDGDMRALFRRRADPCRARSPHHLDLNYNIFRASTRLLDGISLPCSEVISAVDADPRLVDMLWFHSATHCTGSSVHTAARDREVWSRMDVRGQGRGDPGWAALEWRLARGTPDSGRVQVSGLRFERVPQRSLVGTDRPRDVLRELRAARIEHERVSRRRGFGATAESTLSSDDDDEGDDATRIGAISTPPAIHLLRHEFDFELSGERSATARPGSFQGHRRGTLPRSLKA